MEREHFQRNQVMKGKGHVLLTGYARHAVAWSLIACLLLLLIGLPLPVLAAERTEPLVLGEAPDAGSGWTWTGSATATLTLE